MSNEGPKDLVDGASDIAVTALTAAASSGAGSGSDSNGAGSGSDSNGVGLRQMLLTILAPTLALVGIGIGVWDSSRQEASARQREDQVRRATLVLPYYDKVITAQDEVDAARTKCDTAWELWFETDSDSPEEKAAEAEAEAVCVEVTSSFTKLNSALNQALLVSNEELEPVVADYKKAQSDYQSLWDGAGGATPECFPVSSEDPDFDGMSEEDFNDMSEEQFNDMSDEDLNAVVECRQTAFEDAIEDAKSTLDGLRDKMTDVVQDQVLLDQNG